MASAAPVPRDSGAAFRQAVGVHRHFHGRWSGWTLAIGLAVNLAGLSGLARLALGA